MENQLTFVCFGEILWDLLPSGALPGGAPMNVAYHLHTLGLKPRLVTRLGIDERGEALLEILRAKNIDSSFVQTDDHVPTGIVHAKANEAGDMMYDIVSPAAWDGITIGSSLVAMVATSDYFIFGSLSARAATTRATLFSLLDIAKQKVLDINLRAPHYQQELLEQLMNRADLLKMNNEELSLISAWYHEVTDVKEQILFLMDKFSISSLLVTRGAAGAIVNYKGEWAEHPGFTVTVADTVGSGDSFLAGFLYCITNGLALNEALEFACGLGSFVATQTGAWPAYKVEEIRAFIDKP